MNLTINGKKEELKQVGSLTDIFHHLKISEAEKGFAVAINEEVVFRTSWQNAELHDGDRIEIIRATQGG